MELTSVSMETGADGAMCTVRQWDSVSFNLLACTAFSSKLEANPEGYKEYTK